MKLPRRKFLRLAASTAALPAMSWIARAQAYPSRPVLRPTTTKSPQLGVAYVGYIKEGASGSRDSSDGRKGYELR
jgi:hypothetical protein